MNGSLPAIFLTGHQPRRRIPLTPTSGEPATKQSRWSIWTKDSIWLNPSWVFPPGAMMLWCPQKKSRLRLRQVVPSPLMDNAMTTLSLLFLKLMPLVVAMVWVFRIRSKTGLLRPRAAAFMKHQVWHCSTLSMSASSTPSTMRTPWPTTPLKVVAWAG